MKGQRTTSEGGEGRKRAISNFLMIAGVLACMVMGYAQRSENRRPEPDPRARLTPELAAQPSHKADHSEIVILKNKVAGDLAAADQGTKRLRDSHGAAAGDARTLIAGITNVLSPDHQPLLLVVRSRANSAPQSRYHM